MKAVLISIQPYYVFLIIAHAMGCNIPQIKTVEVRKNFPQANDWDKESLIYCSRNKQSFNRIPKKYQPFMEKLLGKIIGEFLCDKIYTWKYDYSDGVDIDDDTLLETMLDREEINIYAHGKTLYGLHISDIKIYDKPKELSEFKKGCNDMEDPIYGSYCEYCESKCYLKRPPQSWCYVEEEEQ